MAAIKINRCKCGNEVPIGRRPGHYCSEACRDKYGPPRLWERDMPPESKADTAIKQGLKWTLELEREQVIDWYARTQRGVV